MVDYYTPTKGRPLRTIGSTLARFGGIVACVAAVGLLVAAFVAAPFAVLFAPLWL